MIALNSIDQKSPNTSNLVVAENGNSRNSRRIKTLVGIIGLLVAAVVFLIWLWNTA